MWSEFSIARQISLGDVSNLLLVVLAVPTLIITLIQTRSSALTSRAQFLLDLHRVFHEDKDIMSAFYVIEYNKVGFDESLAGSDTEKAVDKLLSHCDLVCMLYYQKMINGKDMQIFDYYLRRIKQWIGFDPYMRFLNRWTEQIGENTKPFASLQYYVSRMRR